MAEDWVKYPRKIGNDFKTGKLSESEFTLLSYMFSQYNRETGIIITNSRLLSIEINADRKRVSNLLTALKKKDRIRTPDRDKTETRQSRGSTKPYELLLCDAVLANGLDGDKTETRQRQDRDKTLGQDRGIPQEPCKPAEPLIKPESGKFLAKTDTDLEGLLNPCCTEPEQDFLFNGKNIKGLIDGFRVTLQLHDETEMLTYDEVGKYLLARLNEFGLEIVIKQISVLSKQITTNVHDPLGFFRAGCQRAFQ